MHTDSLLLALVVITALGFDFTNGFHDTANAMATTVATRALKPRMAVALASAMNLLGAFLSLKVAATVASGIVDQGGVTLSLVLAGLTGAIIWNVVTWFIGMPSSSSHALIGGVIGATIASLGASGVLWHGVVSKVLFPALFAPLVAGGVAAIAVLIARRGARATEGELLKQGSRAGQIVSASLISLAHGTNDAQKTMGVITLALVANHSLAADGATPPWVIVACAIAIALGTFSGGWRVINTLGTKLFPIESTHGIAAQSSSAATILASTHFGYPLSTTQVASGSIIGTGMATGAGRMNWPVVRSMVLTWVITLPGAGLVGALAMGIERGLGSRWGSAVNIVLLICGCALLYFKSQATKISHHNVNEVQGGDAAKEAV